MKKAVFLASLAVMTASVWGMNNVNSSNTADVPEARRAVRFNSDMVDASRARKIIRSKLNSNAAARRHFFDNLLYVHNLNLNKFILEARLDQIVEMWFWLEGSDKWKKGAKNVLVKNGVSGVNEKSIDVLLVESLVGLRDKQKEQGQEIDPEVISAIKHAFECKDLFSCLLDIRSRILSNEIYRLLLMYKNKTSVNANELNEYIDDKMKNFLEYAKEDFLNSMIEKNEKDMLKIMVEYGADINKGDDRGRTPFFKACESGNESLVKYLVERGAEVNKEDGVRETPLFYACESGNESLVKYLIDHGADVKKEDKWGKTLLFKACESGNESLVKYLIDHGADVNKGEKYGETPLFKACESGNESLVKYLIEQGADVNKEEEYGETPFFDACRSGNLNLVKHLVEEQGADINKENEWRETPFFDACRSGNLDLVKYLVEERGAAVNKKNSWGGTPLGLARCEGYGDIVKYLWERLATARRAVFRE